MALPTSKKQKKRGLATAGGGLSQLQRKLLIWLCEQEDEMEASHVAAIRKEHHTKGVRWHAKRFFDDAPTRSQEGSVSRTLARLAQRGLITRYDSTEGEGRKPNTTHIKLTKRGRREAVLLINFHGMSQREIQEEARHQQGYATLWRLRREWKSEMVEYRHGMEVFEREGGVLFEIGGPGHDGSGWLYMGVFEEEHQERINDLEKRISELEHYLGEPHKPLQVPDTWLPGAEYYNQELAKMKKQEEFEAFFRENEDDLPF